MGGAFSEELLASLHATVGNLESVGTPSSSADSGIGRIRVRLGGAVAAQPWASELAAELDELVANAIKEATQRQGDQPAPEPTDAPPTVSLQGVVLSPAELSALKHRLLEHVRRREAGRQDDPAPGAPSSGGAQ